MNTASDKLTAFADGDLSFDELVAWARTFPWKPVRILGVGDLESPYPWPQADTVQEITAAVNDGVLDDDQADILLDTVGELL